MRYIKEGGIYWQTYSYPCQTCGISKRLVKVIRLISTTARVKGVVTLDCFRHYGGDYIVDLEDLTPYAIILK